MSPIISRTEMFSFPISGKEMWRRSKIAERGYRMAPLLSSSFGGFENYILSEPLFTNLFVISPLLAKN